MGPRCGPGVNQRGGGVYGFEQVSSAADLAGVAVGESIDQVPAAAEQAQLDSFLDEQLREGVLVGGDDQAVEEEFSVERLFVDANLRTPPREEGGGVGRDEEGVFGDLRGDVLPEDAVAGQVEI